MGPKSVPQHHSDRSCNVGSVVGDSEGVASVLDERGQVPAVQSPEHQAEVCVPVAPARAEDACQPGSNPGSPARPPASEYSPSGPLGHELHDSPRARADPTFLRRGASDLVDKGRPEAEGHRIGGPGRVGGESGQEAGHPLAAGGDRVEQGKPQEGRPREALGDPALDDCPPECYYRHPPEGSHGKAHDRDRRRRQRPDGLREVLRQDICSCEGAGHEVLRVGQGDQQGGGNLHSPPALCRVAEHDGGGRRQGDQDRGDHPSEEEASDKGRLWGDSNQQGGGDLSGPGRDSGILIDRRHGAAVGADCDPIGGGGEGLEGGSQRGHAPEDAGQERCGDEEGPGQPLSQVAASAIAHKSQLVVPNMFEDLVGKGRMEFLEVACEPDSLLADTVRARTGRSDAAGRSSLWCGHDLATSAGLSKVLEQIHVLRPRNVWVSPPCGPYSPLQHVNQRTPSQIRDLKAKRATAQRIYESTLEIVKVCLQLGVHVVVELAERCEAWRLPVFQS